MGKISDTPTMVLELIKRLKLAQPGDNAMVLLGAKTTPLTIVETAVRLIDTRGRPARAVQGINLDEEKNDFSQRKRISYIGLKYITTGDGFLRPDRGEDPRS